MENLEHGHKVCSCEHGELSRGDQCSAIVHRLGRPWAENCSNAKNSIGINGLVAYAPPFTREGSQVQSLSRPPFKQLNLKELLRDFCGGFGRLVFRGSVGEAEIGNSRKAPGLLFRTKRQDFAATISRIENSLAARRSLK